MAINEDDIDTWTNELGEKIASESESEEDYAEGLSMAIDILQMAYDAAKGK